jgi:signal peptide peptidase SppA
VSKKNILLAITNGLWLIDHASAETLGERVASVLNGNTFWDREHKAEAEVLVVEENYKGSYISAGLSGAPAGSVAVISISGPIMKEDNCGDPGTKSYEKMILNALDNPNITGIVLQIDSPGGTVAGTQQLASVIKNANKPVVAIAEDLMASAAYWIGSSANYVFANNNTTRVGSVGTMLSFADMQPMWEAKGVKFHEIYATASLAKNKDFAEARKGNYDAIIKSTLDPLNNEFLGAVKANRGDKLNQDKTLNGQVYLAQEAQSNGLIDAIGSLQDAVNKVYELAEAKNQKPNLTQQNTMKATITLLAAHAALLAICGATIPEGKESVDVELNNDLLEKINSGLLAAGTAEKALADEKTSHASTQKELDELKAKSAGATATQKEGNDQIEGKEKEDFTCDVDLEMREVRKRIYQN